MALVFWASLFVLPLDVCVVLALVARVLLTGGLHEDGFADFCDGFGGGTDRRRTLEIMKDSHIGTYGVLGLLLYSLLMFAVLRSVPHGLVPWLLLCADPFSKWVSSNIVRMLPYARVEAEAKNKVVYDRTGALESAVSLLLGAAPMAVLLVAGVVPMSCLCAMALPLLAFVVLVLMMLRRIQGYTGDCCGALFVVCELAFCLGVAAVSHLGILMN
jgi:adenosylcobinamide-GDP ribazoletransferase